MKRAFIPAIGPVTSALAVAFRTVVATAALALTAGTASATSVLSISGGPTLQYPTGAGYVDGDITTEAEYNTPCGLAMDQSGNYLFVADRDNNAVRVLEFDINTTGTLLTLTNNVPAYNLFSNPVGVAVDSYDNVFVLNQAQNTNGTVLEFDYMGDLLSTNLTHITNAAAIALDHNDDIFVTASNQVIEVASGGAVSTLATITATNASLAGIVVKHDGLLAVCDRGRNGILLINPGTGVVTTNAGFHGQGDFITVNDSTYSNIATFFQPSGIAETGDGNLIVSDYGNDRVKAVLPNGSVTNVYGVSSNYWVSPWPGYVDGTVTLPDQSGGVAARCPNGLVIAPDGTLYVTEDYYHIIRQVKAGFTAPPPPAPGAPTGLTATLITNALGSLEIELSWNGNPQSDGVTNYVVSSATSSGGPYSVLTVTNGTTVFDGNLNSGWTYYFVVAAENSGGISGASAPVSIATPIPPPPAPTIGWFDYEFNGLAYVFTFHPITNGVFTVNNDANLAIDPNASGVNTYYLAGQYPVPGNATNGATAPPFLGNQGLGTQTPLPLTPYPTNEIEAVNVNVGEASPVETVLVQYQCGTPALAGTNAAQFYLTDISTNITYYYTTDGSDPLTNQIASQSVVSSTTNISTLFSINISSNFTFSVRAFRSGYAPSPLVTNEFFAQNFHANELTWGFENGEASSEFIASPGEMFYAPVTLTTLPGAVIYSMDFDMTVTNLGSHPVPPGDYSFQSMLKQPVTDASGDTVLAQIPPYMYVAYATNPPAPNQLVDYNGTTTNFETLEVYETNINELAVGWLEMYPKTNLYNTKAQTLITYSQAYINVYPGGEHPNGVIVGGYAFQVPTNAVPGEQYQIQLNRPSADSDGAGGAQSGVAINVPTIGSLSNGPMNSIKIVTVAQPKYLVGDVYPFQWFNAGDFGNGDLITYGISDIQDVFDYAVYNLNAPQPGSDFADAMDSAGGMGAYDAAAGYWTNNPNANMSAAQEDALYNVNDSTSINQMAFGDGKLDVCDVFVTYVRSQFPGLVWFQRFYTNDPVHGVFGRVAEAITTQTNVDNALTEPTGAGNLKGAADSQDPSSASITNTPLVRFSAGDYLASPGEPVSIPITTSVFGLNPLRMCMFNVNVVPLDGSPALTTPVTFTANTPFNSSSVYDSLSSTGPETNDVANYAAAFMPATFPIPQDTGVTGSNVIGYLNLVIPTNAVSTSAYALSFAHASASPNGLVSFPRTTYTGLITLSSRTNSYYNDGIPDSWRLRYFGTIYNQLSVSNADADGTGMNNWQKYKAGLDPLDPTSVLNEGIDQSMAQSPRDFVLYWPSVAGQTYVIERSPTLFPPQWTPISTNMGDGTYMEIHDFSGAGNGYYKVTTQ